MAAILVGLNVASYTQRQKAPESEMFPNRSTFNSGPTGVQALYSLLSETGRKVVRWQEPPDSLEIKRQKAPATFVVIGPLRRDFTEAEYASLFRWVSGGGRLVVIDRDPPSELVKTTVNWKLTLKPQVRPELYSVDPSNVKAMIGDTPVAKPAQPSLFAYGVNAVQTSKFASTIDIEPQPEVGPQKVQTADVEENSVLAVRAPVAHLISNSKNILVDIPYGVGRIVILSDPYVVANGGISLVDNAQLAVNIVSNGDGPIAFDEYHQGYGGNKNRLFEFFDGTPVVAIFFQCLLIVGFVFFSRSRRFGRAIPANEPDRLSKLEYVEAMAALQQRARTFDLAIENIYRSFRRQAARLLTVDNSTISRIQFATLIAERANADASEVDELMFKCEEIIAGEPTNKRQVLELVTSIRNLERSLGSRRLASK